MERTDLTHECPAVGCEARVTRAMLACRPHWFALPAQLRTDIWAAHRSRDRVAHRQAVGAAVRWYKAQA